jgi:hypothetical protein
MAAAVFTAAAFMAALAAAVFAAAAGAVAAGAAGGVAAGAAAAGVGGAGAGAVVGAAAGIAGGVGDWRLARSSARPLILIMATDMEIHMAMDMGQATVTAADPVAG